MSGHYEQGWKTVSRENDRKESQKAAQRADRRATMKDRRSI